MSNSSWAFLARMTEQSPGLMISMAVALLLLPIALVPISRTPLFVALGNRFPIVGGITTFFVGIGAIFYYWTVGLAAVIYLIVVTTSLFSPAVKALVFG